MPEFLIEVIQQYQPKAILSSLDFQVAVDQDSFYQEVLRDLDLQEQLGLQKTTYDLLQKEDGRLWVLQDELL